MKHGIDRRSTNMHHAQRSNTTTNPHSLYTAHTTILITPWLPTNCCIALHRCDPHCAHCVRLPLTQRVWHIDTHPPHHRCSTMDSHPHIHRPRRRHVHIIIDTLHLMPQMDSNQPHPSSPAQHQHLALQNSRSSSSNQLATQRNRRMLLGSRRV